jgi:hypothetical protein
MCAPSWLRAGCAVWELGTTSRSGTPRFGASTPGTPTDLPTVGDRGLVPRQATFARSTTARRRRSSAWRFRQMMYRRIMPPCSLWSAWSVPSGEQGPHPAVAVVGCPAPAAGLTAGVLEPFPTCCTSHRGRRQGGVRRFMSLRCPAALRTEVGTWAILNWPPTPRCR